VADGRQATDRKARLRSDPVGVGALDWLAEVALEQRRIDAARPGDERQDRRCAASTAEDERLDDLALTDAERDGSLGGLRAESSSSRIAPACPRSLSAAATRRAARGSGECSCDTRRLSPIS
jgi:hypothetical protein